MLKRFQIRNRIYKKTQSSEVRTPMNGIIATITSQGSTSISREQKESFWISEKISQ